MVSNFIRYFIFKYFFKKFLFGILLFVFAYFGLEELSIIQSAIGTENHEITKQVEIKTLNTVMESKRMLKYTLSNIGLSPLNFKLMVSTRDIRPDYDVGGVFKTYSNTKDQRLVKITPYRPFENHLILDIKDLPPGVGMEIIFPDKRKHENYFSQLDIDLDSSLTPTLFEHKLNRSPISIMLSRYSMLLLICLSTSAIIYSLFGAGASAFRDWRGDDF